jgi:prephenate dehydrogenase
MSSIINTSRIAIIGLGQLGGSLAMRLTELGARSVFGIARREESLKDAVRMDIIEAGSTDPAEVLPVADIAFICLPVDASIAFVKEHLSLFRTGSIVTDVGGRRVGSDQHGHRVLARNRRRSD